MTDRPALTREINMTITVDDVERELRTIITSDGADHVYKPPQFVRSSINNVFVQNQGGCRYAHEDPETEAITEGCIVGVWLSRFHGAELPTLVGELSHARELINDGTVLRDETVEPDAVTLLRQVQIHQDNKMPWGTALEEALRELAEGDYEIEDDDSGYPDNDDEDEDQDDEDGYNDPDQTPRD